MSMGMSSGGEIERLSLRGRQGRSPLVPLSGRPNGEYEYEHEYECEQESKWCDRATLVTRPPGRTPPGPPSARWGKGRAGLSLERGAFLPSF